MVLDDLSSRERNGLITAFTVAVVFSAGIGYAGATLTDSSTGFTGDSISTDEVRSTVQSLMDQQVAQQQQQLLTAANQSENISREDVSIQRQVDAVEDSAFPSFYRVTVATTGQVPSQTGEIQSLDQDQVFYISKDGRYLFSQPTDLEAQQQQTATSVQ